VTPIILALCLLLITACGGSNATLDHDRDGSLDDVDCNNNDSSIYWGAPDPFGDGIDQDCDGEDGIAGDGDADDDGYPGNVPEDDPLWDCDDNNPEVHPGQLDIPGDDIDQDCNGSDAAQCYKDLDEDGYGNSEQPFSGIEGNCDAVQLSDFDTDCDDLDEAINPSAYDEPGDGIDQDCNGSDAAVCYEDLDEDGYGSGPPLATIEGNCDAEQLSDSDTDCDDTSATVNPSQDESCSNGIDDDCDEAQDCFDLDCAGDDDCPDWDAVDAGGYFTCGIRTDQSVDCWGNDQDDQVSDAPSSGAFLSISTGGGHACALTAAGVLECWGKNNFQQVFNAPGGPFEEVTSGENHSCVLAGDQTIACWGANGEGQAAPPEGSFTQIDAFYDRTCALATDGAAHCWGDESDDENELQAGPFQEVATGWHHSCAIGTLSDEIECWGADINNLVISAAPTGAFQDLCAGLDYSCAVDVGGAISCWGVAGHPVVNALPPAVTATTFKEVVCGTRHACGWRETGQVLCWGDNSLGETTVP